MARIEGMLSATLPQHASRLDEHDRAITNLAATVTQQGQDIAAVKAVATERAVETRDQAAARRTVNPGWAVAGFTVSAIAVVVTVLLFTLQH